tara:strand:+ start:1698 stop:2063 length:366 start_codon:yes stop_codon:yes gene_type:complete
LTEEVYTVTLLADHKGQTRPSVFGDEYMVDAIIDVSTYDASGVVLSASDFGLGRINAISNTGIANVLFYPTFVISGTTGAYTSDSSVTMLIVQNLQATPAEVADGGTHSGMQFRVRVCGNI